MLVPGDYLHAVLHLAWSRSRTTKERRLIFGWVELLPAEVPPPHDDYDPKGGFEVSSDRMLHVRHAVVPVDDALAWYEAARVGTACLPRIGGGLPPWIERSTTFLELLPFSEDLTWPRLVCLESSPRVAPFVPDDLGSVRAHHLVPDRDVDPRQLWPEPGEAEKALAWLEGQLHFDLAANPELLGSLHLVAPNPVYRSLRTRLMRGHRPDGTRSDGLAIQLELRTGHSAGGLELVCDEVRDCGVVQHRRIMLDGPEQLVPFGGHLGGHSQLVVDAHRGVLETCPSSTFLEAIKGNISLVQMRRVEAASGTRRHRKGTDRAPEESFEVAVSSEPQAVHVGRTNTRVAALKLASMVRRAREREGRRVERWFSGAVGDAEVARRLVRTIINRGRKAVWLVDPYLGPDELWNFGTTIGSRTVSLRLLTGADVLKEACKLEAHEEQGDALEARLLDLRTQLHNPIEVRVMTGAKPDVHDRFLVVDDDVYLLGSSLNEFGQRGTMLVQLQHATGPREGLAAAWEDAQPFDAWLADRRKKRRRRPQRSRLRAEPSW